MKLTSDITMPRHPNTTMAPYMRDVAQHPCLTPEDEVRLGRDLEELDAALWQQLLSYPPLVDHLVARVEAQLELRLPELRALRRCAAVARRSRNRADRAKLARAAQRAALRLLALDPDREHLNDALAEVERMASGELRGTLLRARSGRVFQSYRAQLAVTRAASARVRRRFVEANLRLVVTIARRFTGHGLPLPDLIQEGNLGLMKAVDRFDYRRGNRFSTYASWWIRHYMRRALQDKVRTVRVPVHLFDAYHRLSRLRQELSASLGRAPTAEEVRMASGYSPEKLDAIETRMPRPTVSLDEPYEGDEGRTRHEVVTDPEDESPSQLELVSRRISTEQALQLFQELSLRERDILRKRFALEGERTWTLREIAAVYCLSRERVRQIEERALGKLRRRMKQLEQAA